MDDEAEAYYEYQRERDHAEWCAMSTVEQRAEAKRARKAAKLARDMERTADGRDRCRAWGPHHCAFVNPGPLAGPWGGKWILVMGDPRRGREGYWDSPRITMPDGTWTFLPKWRKRLEAKRRRTDPLSCPCQRLDIEDPGPHRSFCRYHARNVASVDPDEEMPL